MATCELSDRCSFFRKEWQVKPTAKEYLCNTLCIGHFYSCARYNFAISQGIGNVPPKFLPDPLKCLRCFATCDAWNGFESLVG